MLCLIFSAQRPRSVSTVPKPGRPSIPRPAAHDMHRFRRVHISASARFRTNSQASSHVDAPVLHKAFILDSNRGQIWRSIMVAGHAEPCPTGFLPSINHGAPIRTAHLPLSSFRNHPTFLLGIKFSDGFYVRPNPVAESKQTIGFDRPCVLIIAVTGFETGDPFGCKRMRTCILPIGLGRMVKLTNVIIG